MFIKTKISQIIIASLGVSLVSYVQADRFDPAIESFVREQQRQESERNQQRQEELQKQIQPERDVRLEAEQPTRAKKLTDIQEEQCFAIQQVELTGEMAQRFQFALNKALKQVDFKAGMCLGVEGINLLMTQIQNNIIDKGYTTTRILAEPQDLKSGVLKLIVIPGLIRHIRFDSERLKIDNPEGIHTFSHIFPIKNGDVLNLRRLEQGLENLKRVPTVEADIQIIPAENPNESDVLIKWTQRTVPIRLSIGIDDSGSKSTGKNQGNVTISADNVLGLSDLFYISLNRDLGHKGKIRDQNNRYVKSGTNGLSVHYSVPFKNWLLSTNINRYHYNQAVAGLDQVYDYSGDSVTQDIGLNRLLYRDAKRKTTAGLKGWFRQSNSYIDDAEVTVQKRRVSGWQVNIDHREYIGTATVDLNLAYKQGTGAKESLRAPEEQFDEGTSRMKIITLDANLGLPFQIGKQNFSYSSALRMQWNKTPLTSQDRISIGGRYSVRGFDGDMSLMAERGFYWRNELAWSYLPAHQVYLAVDGGHVSGNSAQYLLGQTLIGSAIGLRGQFKVGGQLYYDIFAGKPLKKPEHFQTAKTAYGFSLSYSY